ncbi:MAG: PAS domain S-box protein, partial [Desulfuromonadales bacterium]|nr:PAS domain S-box protein [Desulfuromonadales bacterium]
MNQEPALRVMLATADALFAEQVAALLAAIPGERFVLARGEWSGGEPAGIDIALVDFDADGPPAQLREALEAAGIPLILLTAAAASGQERQLVEAGAVDLVEKSKLTAGVLERVLQHAGRVLRANRRIRQREQQLAAIIEAFDGYIYICSPARRLTYMNDRLRRRTGRNAVGELCHQALHGLEEPCPWCEHERILGGETLRREVQGARDERWYFVVDTPFAGEGGEVSRLAMMQDITERTLAGIGLRQSEERYRSLVENINLGIAMIDTQGRVVMINSGLGRLIGRSAGEVFGRPCHEVFWGEAQVCAGCPGEEAMASGRAVCAEMEKKVAGRRRYLRIQAFPSFGETGSPNGFIAVIDDFTERRRAEVALQKLNANLERIVAQRTSDLQRVNHSLVDEIAERRQLEEALRQDKEQLETAQRELARAYSELKATQARILQQEKMASIGQLAAGVAHEINNPMGFIGSNLNTLQKYFSRLGEFLAAQGELLARGEGGAPSQLVELRRQLKVDYILGDVGDLISESLDGADRVKKIVQDLKTFSRRDEGECRPADLNACLVSTINVLWNEIKYKATLEKELGEIPLVRCNPQQLTQVFMNLLVNAAQAIDKQGVIRVRSSCQGNRVQIAISDNGCGIPAELLPRLFEPFFTTKP